MQNNFLTTIRSLKIIDGCSGPTTAAGGHHHQNFFLGAGGDRSSSSSSAPSLLRPSFSLHSNSLHHRHHHRPSSSSLPAADGLPCGLPSPDLLSPSVDPFLRPVDPVSSLSLYFRRLHRANEDENEVDEVDEGEEEVEEEEGRDLCDLYLEQRALLRHLGDPKLLAPAPNLDEDDDEERDKADVWFLVGDGEAPPPSSAASAPRSDAPALPSLDEDDDEERDEADVWFLVGEGEGEAVPCVRSAIAALSKPLNALLYGGFAEAQRDRIDFSRNGVSPRALRAARRFARSSGDGDGYGEAARLPRDLPRDLLLELLAFANKFCCEALKSACDAALAASVLAPDDALLLIDPALEESSSLLVAACLQSFLRDLPRSLHDPEIARLLCGAEGRELLAAAGHASFALYHFLSHVAVEEDATSNAAVMLLERLAESAAAPWQRQLALHQLGCVMLARGEFKDAQRWFEDAAAAGHVYSLAGVARAKFKRGHKYSAYKLMNSIIDDHDPAGWMYQERSLYCIGKEKMADLRTATDLDPTLVYPYMYRAVSLLEDDKIGAAIAEINKILAFRVSTECLELRAWFYLALEDYEGALQDIRALMTLDPDYMMFHGKIHGDHLIELLRQHVQQWDLADCWMQLYDRWSAVDDIGSLAVVHQMLAKEPGNSSLRFRQSLLLLRLNCQKAAMRSLRLARNHSTHEYERLVYEGWILYDTGHREEALIKAEESIAIQRSFEAFFLKAYVLADTSLETTTALYVIQLLEQANSCASDNLRKGQAHNNMGSIYVDCDMLDEAAECYLKALGIKHTRAHQGLARVYYLKNQKKSAYDEMTKLIEKAKNNASAYEKRSEYCDRDMAKSDLNMATRLDPTRTYPYRYRAAVLMDDHKEEEAIAELSRVIAFKLDLQLLHLRAAFYDSMGDSAATLRDCEAALCLDPAHADTLDLYNKAREKSEPQS
ncbi:ethylene-overproduction protein 1-like [Ananas comosus]|uniref:Ethylene-overproduction protein 1-like n=1 Tax=Ananas comosus TaxID=4615 RepID=A0A6P5G3Z4_ANACO|nr:ethylene-overproduction protein 1-like [Ananas comosus]